MAEVTVYADPTISSQTNLLAKYIIEQLLKFRVTATGGNGFTANGMQVV
jgi:hypothetical protein